MIAIKLGEILAQQLALLPVQDTLLRTVVHTAAAVDAYPATIAHARTWLGERAEAFELRLEDRPSFRRETARCRVEIEQSGQHFAFVLDHQDERAAERRWLTECVVSDEGERANIDVRLSIVRPQKAATPPRYAPSFLRDIALDVGLEDVRALSPAPWFVDSADVEDLHALLTSPDRSLAVVAISVSSNGPLVPPETLAMRLLGVAHTAILSERASWDITHLVAREWSVFRGAVRRYGPGLHWSDNPRRHRLWLPEVVARADAEAPRTGFLETCVESAFAAATADFETAIPFQTPRDVARKRATPSRLVEISAPVASAEPSIEPKLEPAPPESLQPDTTDGSSSSFDFDASSIEQRIAALEQELHAERTRVDDIVRQRDETIQSLQAKNAALAADIDLTHSLLRESEAENNELRLEIGTLRGDRATFEGPLAPLLGALSDTLIRARDISTGMARHNDEFVALRSDFEALTAERDELARERHQLAARVEALESRGRPTEDTVESPAPGYDEPDRFVEYVDRRYRGRVVVSNVARKSFRDLVYRDPERLYEAVDLLGNEYVAMRTFNGVGPDERRRRKDAFEQRLSDMRLTHGPTATDVGAGRHPGDHEMLVDGKSLPCEKIRDIGRTFDPQRFLCIYFVWDPDKERIVLKGFEHGATISAHT